MTRFLLLLLSLAAIIVAVAYAGASWGLFPFPSFLWVTEGVLIVSTASLFYFLYRRPPGLAFVQVYLFSIASKICLYGIFAALIIIKDKPGAPSNVVFFLVSYIVFTALEVGTLFRKMNNQNPLQKIK